MSFHILILCRGNVTRSPFIAGYLNHLYRTSELAHKIHLDIDSSGIEGRTNFPVHHRILEKGLELGFDLAMYRSKHSDLKSLEKSDLIIVVDQKQYNRFAKNYRHLLKKVHHIYDLGREGEYETIDLEDPSHLESEEEFDKFFQLAISETERIWEYIKRVYYKAEVEGVPFDAHLLENPRAQDLVVSKNYNIITKRFFPICPGCQSKRIRRVKRKGFFQKKIYPYFDGYPYHCGNCGKTFILFIGSAIHSKPRSETKREQWQQFMEEEMARRRMQDG
jgi:protein-tyrosine-phosphatase